MISFRVADEIVDRPARRIAFEQNMIGLERRLNLRARHAILRLEKYCAARGRVLSRRLAAAPRGRGLRDASARSRVNVVSALIDSISCVSGDVGAEIALKAMYCGLSSGQLTQPQLVQRSLPSCR